MASPAALTWMRRLAWAVASVLLLWGVLWVAAPPLMRAQSQKRLSAALGRPVTIEAVEFKPWSMEVTVRGLAIGPAPGAGTSAPPLLQVARLYANGDWRSMLRFAPVIAQLEIDAPQLHVARTAPGRYDIDDIIDRMVRPADTGTGTTERGPARFALHNLQLRDGAITFDDRPVQRRHQVTALQVSLPFLSSLPSQVEVVVQPRLSFQLGDTRVDTGAQTTPFAPDRETAMTLRMSPLDLAPLAAYLPADLPVRLLGGHAKADVSVHFERRADGSPALSLRGTMGADGIALADRTGAPLAQWKALHLEVVDAQPLERKLELGTVRFEGLQLAVTRDAQGGVNVARLAGPAAASSPAPATAGAAWQLRLKTLELADARVSWADATTRPATALALEAIEARLGPAAWPSKDPAPLKLQARLGGGPATLHIEGNASPQKATVAVRADQLALAAFAPYLQGVLQPRLEGVAAVDGTLSWAAEPQALSMDVARFALDDLRVVDGSTRPGRGDAPRDPLSWKALEITGAKVDIAARTASIGRVALRQPRIAVERARDGALNLERWLAAPAPGGAAPAATSSSSAADASSSAPPSWRVTLADASIDDGRVRWSDDAADPARTTPVALSVSALNLSATGLAWPKAAAPADLRVSAVVADPAAPRGSRRQQGGSVDWRGRVALDPLAITGALRVERFPLHALEPYAGRGFNATVQRAEGHWRGDVALRQRANGIEATASGDALLAELHVFGLDPASGAVSPDELLSWRSLQLRGLKVAVAPSAKPRVDIGEAVVSDFYSQLVVTEEGRFNLRDVRAAPPGATPPGGFAVGRQIAPPAPSPAASPPSAAAPSPAASDAAPEATPLRARLPVELRVGGLQLVNGRVDYTDRFVRPNYSAALSELNGRLGAFEAGSRDMATLELTGRVAGTAQLDVRGSLNPMADPLALDVRAKTTDLELAPLSPYAGKYAGYAIDRGKLSMDLHYRVQPDGRLEASNRVVLNQLTFGERIESPNATKLPVRLAVALLKDRNGVIDVNLPVQGSINDPQFSVAGLVVRIIVNLIAKALTAPFSLLAGGGGEDLSVVAFRPGTSTMADDAGAVIDKVAKALEERPTLQMTVTGSADPASEADAIRRNQLERRIAAQQRNEAVRTGRATNAPDAPATGEERARLLRAIYRDTELPDKPRNVLGFEKDVPAPEMEALLLKHLPANPDAARELALQRGVVVRDALVAKGLPSERLFLAAPKLGGTNEPAAPQAKLALAVK